MQAFFSYLASYIDIPILDWIALHLQSTFGDKLMPVITVLGDAGILWIALTLVFLCTQKYRRIGFGMGFALLIGLLVCNVTLKPLIARPRPYDYQLEQFGRHIPLLISAPHDFSFPSGHTLASFEAAVVLALNSKKFGIPALILASLISFSRLYLYVHYPTDVLFSIALGICFGYLGNWLSKLVFKNKFH